MVGTQASDVFDRVEKVIPIGEAWSSLIGIDDQSRQLSSHGSTAERNIERVTMSIVTVIFFDVDTANPKRIDVENNSRFERFDGRMPYGLGRRSHVIPC